MNIINTTFCIVKKLELRDAASEGVLSNLKDRCHRLEAGGTLLYIRSYPSVFNK